jgi:hypothetical protein
MFEVASQGSPGGSTLSCRAGRPRLQAHVVVRGADANQPPRALGEVRSTRSSRHSILGEAVRRERDDSELGDRRSLGGGYQVLHVLDRMLLCHYLEGDQVHLLRCAPRSSVQSLRRGPRPASSWRGYRPAGAADRVLLDPCTRGPSVRVSSRLVHKRFRRPGSCGVTRHGDTRPGSGSLRIWSVLMPSAPRWRP